MKYNCVLKQKSDERNDRHLGKKLTKAEWKRTDGEKRGGLKKETFE